MKDFTECTLNAKRYRNYRVSRDLTTITVHDITDSAGDKFDLKFSKVIEYWEVKLRITAKYHDKPEANHATVASGLDVDEQVMGFWSEMEQLAYEQNDAAITANQSRVVGFLLSEPK